MPRYRAMKPGFMFGRLYGPEHRKRKIVVTDKPLKPVPSWLEPIKDETAKERSTRQKKEKAQAEADAKKRAEDKKDRDAVTFLDEDNPASPTQSNVQSL